MVKTIYAEDSVANYISSFVKKSTAISGVLIGKTTDSKSFAVKAVRCPEKEDERPGEFKLDGGWLGGTAVEVEHMLPGGLCIIGIFVVSKPGSVTLDAIRQALFETYSIVSKHRRMLLKPYQIEEKSFSWTALHINMSNGRPIFCKQFEMADDALAPKQVEWKVQNNATKWNFAKTHLEINETLLLHQISTPVKIQLRGAVHGFCHKVAKALVEVDGQLVDPEEMFDSEALLSGWNPGKLFKRWGRSAVCQFHVIQPVGIPVDRDVDSNKYYFTVRIRGSVFACAYVPSKTTVEDTIQELKIDAITSLHHRCILVADEMDEKDEHLNHNSVITLPKRLAFTEGHFGENFMYFDYTFQDEIQQAYVNRIKETLDTEVTVGAIDNVEDYYVGDEEVEEEVERNFAPSQVMKLNQPRPSQFRRPLININYLTDNINVKYITGSFVFALLAVLIGWLAYQRYQQYIEEQQTFYYKLPFVEPLLRFMAENIGLKLFLCFICVIYIYTVIKGARRTENAT